MGNTPISTSETNIYYPSDWLIYGGPPFESMGCPEGFRYTYDPYFDSNITIAYDYDEVKWKVINGGEKPVVLMESSNKADVANYITDYMIAMELWVDENLKADNKFKGKTQ